jgi:hypothetical protein
MRDKWVPIAHLRVLTLDLIGLEDHMHCPYSEGTTKTYAGESREHRAPSCQRKAAKNAGGLSGEGQAVLCVQTAKKPPVSLTQNQPPKTGKVAA